MNLEIAIEKIQTYGVRDSVRRLQRRLQHTLRSYLNLDHLLSARPLQKQEKLFVSSTPFSPIDTLTCQSAAADPEFVHLLKSCAQQILDKQIDWNLDTYSKKRLPNKHFGKIRFSTADDSGERFGDFMFSNEINKHGWVPLLALAYSLTGHSRYLQRLEYLLKDWRATFHIGWGVPYLTTLNVAQRLIHWMLAYQVLIREAGTQNDIAAWLAREGFREFYFLNIYNQSYYAPHLRNNYSFCEAVAALSYLKLFPGINHADRLRNLWRSRLRQECDSQIDADGFTREGSLLYSRFIAEILILASLLGENYVMAALKRLAFAIYKLSDRNGLLPGFGDASSERGFDLGVQDDLLDSRTFLAVAGYLLQLPLAKGVGGLDIEYFLLTGTTARPSGQANSETSIHFPIGGYGISEKPWGHLVIDYADIGCLGQGGHGHCDIGSFCLTDRDGEVIVDPGTYLYSSSRKIRDQYRSSEMHNLTQIGNSEMCLLERNLFGIRQAPKVEAKVDIDPQKDVFVVSHGGFLLKGKRVPLTRSLTSSKEEIQIVDEWRNGYGAISRMHFAPDLSPRIIGNSCYLSRDSQDVWKIDFPQDVLGILQVYGYSRSYGKTVAAQRLVLNVDASSDSRIRICMQPL